MEGGGLRWAEEAGVGPEDAIGAPVLPAGKDSLLGRPNGPSGTHLGSGRLGL